MAAYQECASLGGLSGSAKRRGDRMLNKLIVAAALAPAAYYAGSLAYNNNIGTNWNEGYEGPNCGSTTWPTGPGAPNYYAPVGPQGNDGACTGSSAYGTYT